MNAKVKHKEEPKDLWAAAYAELSDREREILLKDEPHGQPSKHAEAKDQAEITDILDRVIETSEQQYKISQEKRLVIKRSDGRQISVRDSSIRILNGVLSYRDLVTTATALDPTGLATKVWRLVSQGLLMIQMVKNYHDLQVDLFESAGFLADILARYALIEKDLAHYNVDTRNGAENAIVRVYKAVLQYTAEARSAQESFSAAQISSIATPSTEQQLRVLRETIEREEGIFHRWNQLDQQLSHRAEAEALVRRLDDLVAPVNAIQDDHVLSKLPVAQYASFDSVNSTLDDDEFECLPGTREDLLHQIMNWGLSVQSTGSIFWLNGMAGTGKSTISRTVARNLKEHGMLGASFFFKRGESDRGNAKKLFSTIVHQLAIEKEFNMCTGLLQDQFKKLLIEPLNEVTSVQKVPTRIVVINDVRRILSLLPEFQSIKTVRVKIFLTSRPEHPIQPGFRLMPSAAHKDFVLHEIKSGVVKGDIEIYLRHKLGQIREENSIHADWPGEGNLKALAEISCPLFISAATFCRFIGAIQFDPERRLVELLRGQSRYASRMGKTYLPVLDQLVAGADPTESAQILHEFQHIVGVIILLETPLSLRSLSALLCTPGQTVTEMEGGIRTRLKLLHSVLSIPVDPLLPIRPLHLSFRDFLVSAPEAEGHRFWVNEQETHGRIADHCIKVMDCLKRNICQLPDYAIERADIGPSALETHLSPELRYACRFWVPHLVRSDAPSKRMKGVLSFLNIHFLHWVEALSLLGCVADGVEMLGALESYFQNDLGPQEKNLLADAKRFVLKGLQMLEQAPLQLYCSGLLFAPTESFVRKTFGNEMPTWITSVRDPEQYWGAELQTLEGHPSGIVHVVFSRDAALLASACSKQIRLWNASTGRLQQMIEPQEGEFSHTRIVQDLIFSPNGKILASCSWDKTIALCDTQTGELLHTLRGHTGEVMSAAFSPKGSFLVSGSTDHTLKLWDSETGSLMHTLTGHEGEVGHVLFFPDGIRVASCYAGGSVKIWDAEQGTLKHSFEGHDNPVITLAHSPCGGKLLSGSWDGTVTVWDTQTGNLSATFQAHHDAVHTMAFVSSGRIMASSSVDRVIKLWDPMAWGGRNQQDTQVDATGFKFSKDGQTLCTAFGSFNLEPWYTAPWHAALHFAVERQWITKGTRRVLWLPLEYRLTSLMRQGRKFAVRGNTIMLGSQTGRLCFLRLDDSVA
ncbi:hypothetical protein BJY00DRAFT_323427 [Aspergillus carlsbadensis]|nr:hypothetical protein BJY00DRAFT_323427 [Aspergillus carlsbadensis]